MRQSESVYRHRRIDHWDQTSKFKKRRNRPGVYYHKLLQHYYRYIIPKGLRILELGCCHGDLLASLEPSFGVGVDFSDKMVRHAQKKYENLHFIRADAHDLPLGGSFDIIILSDLINDLWDVQKVFETMRPLAHARTRIVLNSYNNLWRIPLALIRWMGLGAELLEQNWLTPEDIANLLLLSGFEVINSIPRILLPLNLKMLTRFANRFLVNFIPFKWFALTHMIVARSAPRLDAFDSTDTATVSIIVPARNEAGNIEEILERIPDFGAQTEVIFVEGHSTDNTYEVIQNALKKRQSRFRRLLRQPGIGKGDAVRCGFQEASGDILMILDTDMTVPPEDLVRFYQALTTGKGEFINGVRLVYPMEQQAMRFFNIIGNKIFSLAFSYLLGQPVKDTLCGTKVLWKKDYALIAENRKYFGEFDPFGDFDLLFGAAKLHLRIVDMPVRYRSRKYGATNIQRWRHGFILLRMVIFAARRIRFI